MMEPTAGSACLRTVAGMPAADRPAVSDGIPPLLRWAGGKRRLVPRLLGLMPDGRLDLYVEPFAGSAALFFGGAARRAERAVLADVNPWLVSFYAVVRDDLDGFFGALTALGSCSSEADYRRIRSLDPLAMSSAERAAWFFLLNQTSFNGVWRVNRSGEFNVPWGRRVFEPDVDRRRPVFEQASALLRRAELVASDVTALARRLAREGGAFWYLDPPYVPVSATASFTGYSKEGFSRFDHHLLAAVIRELADRGCRVMLSNSDTCETRRVYGACGLEWVEVEARRSVGAAASTRRTVTELVGVNYILPRPVDERPGP